MFVVSWNQRNRGLFMSSPITSILAYNRRNKYYFSKNKINGLKNL